MKIRSLPLLLAALALACLCAAPAWAAGGDVGITGSSEHEEVVALLLDNAPHMTFVASQTSVKFKVTEELMGKTLTVYDFRPNISLMINNVADVTPDADGFVTIALPSTGDFVVADVPFDATRLVLDLRYLDESLWERAKTPSEPFDTDKYPIPEGEWVDSVRWRERQNLEPYPVVAPPGEDEEEPDGEGAEDGGDGEDEDGPAAGEEISQPEPPQASQPDPGPAAPALTPSITQPQAPEEPKEVPWSTYLVVGVFVGIGIVVSVLIKNNR